MAEKLAKAIINSLSGLLALPFGKQCIVFVISLMPILELRGGLIAAALLGLPPWESYVIAIIANLIPVPFIIYLIETVILKMQNSKIGLFKSLATWIYRKIRIFRLDYICRCTASRNRSMDRSFNCCHAQYG